MKGFDHTDLEFFFVEFIKTALAPYIIFRNFLSLKEEKITTYPGFHMVLKSIEIFKKHSFAERKNRKGFR